MISVDTLYLDVDSASDSLRYGVNRGQCHGCRVTVGIHERPVVVWNVTQRCNLYCRHCYSRSTHDAEDDDELTTQDAMAVIDDLAQFRVPVLLLSGGEPLMRPDLFELATYAVSKGLRVVLSTNGTMLDKKTVARLKEANFSYIGVSLDGVGRTHDAFRKCEGAYERTLQGMRSCRDAGLTVGLRFTVVRENLHEVPAIFDLLEREAFPRVCFYHLAYSGRGQRIRSGRGTHQ